MKYQKLIATLALSSSLVTMTAFPSQAAEISNPIVPSPELNLAQKTTNQETSESFIDTDSDGIYDHLELNGFTRQVYNGINHVVPYIESIHGGDSDYKKYVTNPELISTDYDPYTDRDEVINVEADVLAEHYDPLVANVPRINAYPDKIILSKVLKEGQSSTDSRSHTVSVTRSNSHADTSGWNVSTTVSVGFSEAQGFSASASVTAGVSGSTTNTYSYSGSNSGTSGSTWSKNLEMTSNDAANVNLNLYYRNDGNAPVYNLNPTLEGTLGDSTLFEITTNNNSIVYDLAPGEKFPPKGSTSIRTLDQFKSTPLQLNVDQLNEIEQHGNFQVELSEFKGFVSDTSTNPHSPTWSSIIKNVRKTTAEVTLDLPVKSALDEQNIIRPNTRTLNIVAKGLANYDGIYDDYDNPIPGDNQQTQGSPSITLKEALIKYFNVRETPQGELHTDDGLVIKPESFMVTMDELTSKKVAAELKANPDYTYFDITLRPAMVIGLEYILEDSPLRINFEDYAASVNLKANNEGVLTIPYINRPRYTLMKAPRLKIPAFKSSVLANVHKDRGIPVLGSRIQALYMDEKATKESQIFTQYDYRDSYVLTPEQWMSLSPLKTPPTSIILYPSKYFWRNDTFNKSKLSFTYYPTGDLEALDVPFKVVTDENGKKTFQSDNVNLFYYNSPSANIEWDISTRSEPVIMNVPQRPASDYRFNSQNPYIRVFDAKSYAERAIKYKEYESGSKTGAEEYLKSHAVERTPLNRNEKLIPGRTYYTLAGIMPAAPQKNESYRPLEKHTMGVYGVRANGSEARLYSTSQYSDHLLVESKVFVNKDFEYFKLANESRFIFFDVLFK